MPEFRRKRIRLARTSYLGEQLVFLTLCTHLRAAHFRDPRAAAWLLRRLRHFAAAHAVAIEAFCVMPDHLHVLARGTHLACDMIAFVSEFKRVTAEAWLRRFGGRLWQRHYYDHIIRSGENPDAVCWYIWLNPVRKHLCADPRAYQHTGSFTGRWPPRSNTFLDWLPPWKKP